MALRHLTPPAAAATGGLGKTTLATLLYNQLRSSFSSTAIVSLDLEGSSSEQVRTSLHRVLTGLGESSQSQDHTQLLKRLEDLVKGKKVLLLLDNVNHTQQLNALLPQTAFAPGSRIIITSREQELPDSTTYVVRGRLKALLGNLP